MSPKAPPRKVPARTQSATPEQLFKQWGQKVDGMNAATNAIDWSKVDWSKLSPSDIGVQMGPPMTEEQFRKYREERAAAGGSVHVVNATKNT